MKIFACPACGRALFFDNLSCACGCEVAFDPDAERFVGGARVCANRSTIHCNWMAREGGRLCASCVMTTVHPDLAVPGNHLLWAKAEHAKRRVLTGLRQWGWFGPTDAGGHPWFHMLSEATSTGPAEVTMGHDSGLVTINLAESDAAESVRRREMLGEPYRTLVGHFRHEIAHFLFERLAVSVRFVTEFRALFGDETEDYGAALQRHYANGGSVDWQGDFITAYASAHAHEDWAESAAHTLHLVDMADSFAAAGLRLRDFPEAAGDAYGEEEAARILTPALEIGVALNHVNRAMGLTDLYPFVTPPRVMEKLSFAHRWLTRGAAA